MSDLSSKKILLGVTGGIAAYKAAELVRELRRQGAEVRVVMTEAATAFVAPLTFQALSGHPVHSALFDPEQEAAMSHIHLARWADRILIAPASADFIAKLRIGLADDLLSTLCLAADVPIALAPAMNRGMWENPATQENIDCLSKRGIGIFGPLSGDQACGEQGFGRMLEPLALCAELGASFQNAQLNGVRILISAGPTREALDPIRYISNRSSGRMGYAIAQAAKAAGAKVTLVSGPVSLAAPAATEVVQVENAREMYEAVMSRASDHDIYIGAAAVADYSPVDSALQKIKKQSDQMVLTLRKNPDILASVAALPNAPFTVGFAAETEQLEEYARAKLKAKGLDMIAANRVGQPQGGFDSLENALHIFWPNGHRYLPMAPKTLLAKQLIKIVGERYEAKNTTENPR